MGRDVYHFLTEASRVEPYYETEGAAEIYEKYKALLESEDKGEKVPHRFRVQLLAVLKKGFEAIASKPFSHSTPGTSTCLSWPLLAFPHRSERSMRRITMAGMPRIMRS